MPPTGRRSLGWAGFEPATYDAAKAEATLAAIHQTHRIQPPGLPELTFDPKRDLTFDYGPNLPGHANGMILKATDAQGDVILEETLLLHRRRLRPDRRGTGRGR